MKLLFFVSRASCVNISMESIRMATYVSQELEIDLIPCSSRRFKLHKVIIKHTINKCKQAYSKRWQEWSETICYLHRMLWLYQQSYQGQVSFEPLLYHRETPDGTENPNQRICQAREKEAFHLCHEPFRGHHPNVSERLYGSYQHTQQQIVLQIEREPRTWILYHKKASFSNRFLEGTWYFSCICWWKLS